MDEIRIPPAGDGFHAAGKRSGSTRHHRVDDAFLQLLEEDFGIDQHSLRAAFYGVPPAPKRQAISLCEWSVKASAGDVGAAGDALRAWARKHKAGRYAERLVDAPPATYGGRPPEGV